MKNSVLSNSGYLFNLKMLAVVLLVVCSVRDIQAADNARSKKLNEREKNIKQLIQRHNLWNLSEMFDKHSLCNQVRRVKDNFQEIEDIAQFSAQLQTKIDAFQTAIDNCHPREYDLKPSLQMVHAQGLLPIPGIIQRFFVGRIRYGLNEIKPACYASTQALAQSFEPTPDLTLFHKQLVQAATIYKKRLKKSYSLHNKKFPQWSVPDQKERAILRQEYRESILPFIRCAGVFAQVQKNNPEALPAAMIIWDNTTELTMPEL